MIGGLLETLGPWAWIILGLVLMGLELLAPGIFLLWLGLAALVTGVLDYGLGLSWQVGLLIFAALSVLAVLGGRALTRRRDEDTGSDSALNRRGHALVGQVFALQDPIVAGFGRIRVDDTSWRVVGSDAPAGASVRVLKVEGATLVVEAA